MLICDSRSSRFGQQMSSHLTNINLANPQSLEVACVGMVTPAEVYVVDHMPDWNTGTKWNYREDFISDDAAIVACCITKWGLGSGLVCNKLGDVLYRYRCYFSYGPDNKKVSQIKMSK